MGVFDLNQPQDPFAQWSSPMAGVAPVQKKKPLYASLFDHMNGQQDPNSVYQMGDGDKSNSFRHGLLQLAAAMATPNGGNFARSLSTGLLAGSNSMHEDESNYTQKAYQNAVMGREKAGIDQQAADRQASSTFLKSDGTFDFNGYGAWKAAHGDAAGGMDMMDKARKMGVHEYGADPTYIKSADGKYEDPYYMDKTLGHLVTMGSMMGGQPQQGPQTAPQGAPMPQGGQPPQMPSASPQTAGGRAPPADIQQIIADAANKYHVPVPFALGLAQQESGFNPSAVGPATKYGQAQGLYQYIPPTAKSLGINPLDPRQSADAAMKQAAAVAAAHGGDWGAAAAEHFAGPNPAMQGPKTRQYVADVMARQQKFGAMGGVDSSPPDQVATVDTPAQPVPFGRREVAAKDGADSVADRAKFLTDMDANRKANGQPALTQAQRNSYMFTKKFPGDDGTEDPMANLTAGQKSLAKAIANYDDLPTSISYKDRTAVMGAVHALSPAYNAPQSAQIMQFKKALAQGSPTSVGGQATSVNTALHHLGSLAKLVDTLPDLGYQAFNSVADAVKGQSDPAITRWNQATNFVSQEAAKLVKGGVATQKEADDMLEPLKTSGTTKQRKAAIAGAAEFFYGRIASLDKQKSDMLSESPSYDGLSLMGSSARTAMAQAYALDNREMPSDMLPPSADAKQKQGAGQHPQAQPANMTKDEALQHLQDARNAVMHGADKAAVRQRMVEMGLPQLAGRL